MVRSMRFSLFVLGLLFLTSGCSFNERVDGILELTADAANGEALLAADCAVCHAADGRGNDLGPGLLGELHHGEKQILTWILDGKSGGEMPAFASYSDQEAADVLSHLYLLAE